MKSDQLSQAFLQRRKMLLVLPLLVLPFLTMIFWSLGGGSGKAEQATSGTAGLNLHVPSSGLRENSWENKLSFYQKAEKDSLKLEEWMRSDPYYRDHPEVTSHTAANEPAAITDDPASPFTQQLNPSPFEKSGHRAEEQLMQRLSLLQKEINKPAAPKPKTDPVHPSLDEASDLSGQQDRLEDMMPDRLSPGTEDPEIQQLSQTLDKILDIQHPQRVKDRLEQMSLKHKEQVFVVSKTAKEENISLLDTLPQKFVTATGFYGLEDKADGALTEGNAIEAVVSANQTLVSGSVIKFRLTTDVYINGMLVPNGSFVYGMASVNNERLEVEIKTIRCENSLLPVNLVVYDVDGLEGIYIPGAITREVAKQSADNSLQMMELSSLDPSLKAQAATAGVHAAKNLLSRKVKQVKVVVKGGYRVLLKNR